MKLIITYKLDAKFGICKLTRYDGIKALQNKLQNDELLSVLFDIKLEE